MTRRATFLTADGDSLTALTASLGYRAVYDSKNDQFAHPAALFVLTPDGRVARVLSGLGIDPVDLRLALVEAGEGHIGTITDQVRLLCYGFDPALGIYTSSIKRWLDFGWLLTAIGLAGAIGVMTLKNRRVPGASAANPKFAHTFRKRVRELRAQKRH